MPNFWLAKTTDEIKAIPSSQCNDGARLWCIDTQTIFRYFQFRKLHPGNLEYYPNAYIVPTNLLNTQLNGVWQNEGDIYSKRVELGDSSPLFYPPSFPPATPTQKVISSFKDDTLPDEEFLIEWIPYYPNYAQQFPSFSTNEGFNDRTWKILNIRTIVSNRNPATEYYYSGDGHIWYKKNENRFFINVHKIMEDETNYLFSTDPNPDNWKELQFANTP